MKNDYSDVLRYPSTGAVPRTQTVWPSCGAKLQKTAQRQAQGSDLESAGGGGGVGMMVLYNGAGARACEREEGEGQEGQLLERKNES
eukprot:6191435-Pleurochrysis_carterae.AAC.3